MAERGNPFLRLVDGVFGPPLLRATSIFRRKKSLPTQPAKIGVMCFGALGDLLLLSAIIPDLQVAYPEAEILILGSGTNKSIAPMLPASNFIELPVKRPDQALRILRGLNLDIIIDSTQWAKLPALLCAGSRAFTVGFNTAGQHKHFAYDVIVEHCNDRHEMQNFRALAAVVGPVTDTTPVLLVSDEAKAKVSSMLPNRFAVLHAWPSGARAELKEWPIENWGALAHHLHQTHGLDIVLTGAPVDEPKSTALAKEIGEASWLIDTTGKFRLSETVAVLENAVITVSVNTGIMHMAATFDVPLVGLSGPTNPVRWGPLSKLAVSPKPDCEGCWYLNLGFEYPENPEDCMGALSKEAVIGAVDELLS
ncbi:glycosyltransferase family 9 protein [Pacificibacter marinus]|uniref:glycosyltransferase family 9 protein n=1 Tax=Pacificibacter marinus TaxID=658057 RepID=UPI001C0780E4|nr:glycosyltransferase family 9 protein [Pacificibacter marinus]MBU2867478.1 glycosyltransferase family 9 protein [Pacificibacter marinus]